MVIDLDKVRDPETGQTEEWARQIVLEVNSYTELSPSGTGYHILVRGTLPPGANRRGRVEMYDGKRYITVTGQHIAGTPLIIETRDLTSLHGRMMRRELDPHKKQKPPAKLALARDAKFDALMAGQWSGSYPSQSEADQALCNLLARRVGPDAAKIDAEFRKSGLYREKWERPDYRERTIEKAIASYHENPPTSAGLVIVEPQPLEEAAEELPRLPAECLESDCLGDLARLLTDGTAMPPDFMHATAKAIAGTIINGRVGFPGQSDLHLKSYLMNVSNLERTGKGEAWKRLGAFGTGYLNSLLQEAGVDIVDGGLFGSGQYAVKVLADLPHRRAFARFDEMLTVFNHNDGNVSKSNTVELKLLELWEKTTVAQGSYTNKRHDADVHLSFSGDFTRGKFAEAFEGRRSQASGFLARCTLAFADRAPCYGDWAEPSGLALTKAVARIQQCLEKVPHLPDPSLGEPGKFPRLIPHEAEDARQLRYEFFAELDAEDARLTSELRAHFKRDLLLRAVFANDSRERPEITKEMVTRSIAWTRHQLDLRRFLWPEDAVSLYERMERRILAALQKRGHLTDAQLIRLCNVNRAGSGGHFVYTRSMQGARAVTGD